MNEYTDLDLCQCRSKIEAVLPSLKSISTVKGPFHLQVKNITDVSRNNGHQSKRLLRLQLTDGHTDVIALELIPCPQLILNKLLPGTKICIKGDVEVANEMLLLYPENVSILGGKVPNLIHKWKTSNSKIDPFLTSVASSKGAPPPPFVDFDPNNIVVKNNINTKKSSAKPLGPRKPMVIPPTTSNAVTMQSLPSKPLKVISNFKEGALSNSLLLCCYASNVFLNENQDKTAVLMFELKDQHGNTLKLSTSNKLMVVLLGLNSPGAPPLKKLWKSKKGKLYLNDRVEKLKIALVPKNKQTSIYTLSKSLKCETTTSIINIE